MFIDLGERSRFKKINKMINFIFSPMFLSALTLAGTVYLVFIKSYFTEKGKNLATKQDLDEITSTVEEIKTEFIRGTERLKAQLQYYSQWKYSLKVEEKNAIVTCYESYQAWFNTLLYESLSEYGEDNIHLIRERRLQINDLYLKFVLAESKFKLYVNDERLYKMFGDIKLATMQLNNIYASYSVRYTSAIEINALATKQIDKNDMDGLFKQIHVDRDKKIEILEKFNSEKDELCSSIFAQDRIIKNLCYIRLTQIDSFMDTKSE